MNKKLFLILAAAASIFAACQKNNNQETPEGNSTHYVLNNGKWNDNNSNVGVYDLTTKTLTPDAFFAANNINLGDLGQDILEYNGDLYIAVQNSKIIFVTDKNLKVKKTIEAKMPTSQKTKLSPKYLAAGYGKVYVTYYEGYLGEINPTDYGIRVTEVGPNPEGLAVCKEKVYVANSGGMNAPNYDNTLSVVDIAKFKEINKISVNLNPEFLEVNPDETILFVSSKGNYMDIPGTLQAVKLSDNSVTDLKINNLVWMSMGNTKLFLLLGGMDENWQPLPGEIRTLDISLSDTKTNVFVKDGTVLSKAYSISATKDDYVFVGCSDYTTNGDVFVFSADGNLYDKFDSQGINPIKIL